MVGAALGNPFRKSFLIQLLFMAAAVTAGAQQYPLVKLTATGSERYLPEDVLRTTGLSEDMTKVVPLAAVQAAAEKLNATGAFAEVKYKHTIAIGGMKVEFELVDKDDDQFVPCDFENIVWLPEAELKESLQKLVPLFDGTVPRGGGLADDVSTALQTILKQRGVVANITATVQEPTNSGTPEAVVFRADNLDIKIAQVTTPGASPRNVSALDAESQKLIGITYNRNSLSKFAERSLRNVLLQRGYLRATFAAPVVDVLANTADKTTIAVALPVTEGTAYKFGALQWTGNKVLPVAELEKILHPAAAQFLDGAELNKQINAVRTRYAAMGYMRMTLSADPTFNDAAERVDYVMSVKEGDLYSMGKFEVEGLQTASAEKVRQLWKMREGDPFDSTYVRNFFTQFRLPTGTPYVVEETEGETPKSVDLTVVFCKTNDPCRPRADSHLFTLQDAEAERKP